MEAKNPYTLFLIFILLILSTDDHTESNLSLLKSFIDQTQHSIGNLRESFNNLDSSLKQFHAAFAGVNNSG